MNLTPADDISNDLADFLAHASFEEPSDRRAAADASEDAYEVISVLKESPAEVTQLVRAVDSGKPGRWVRKLIDAGSGLGGAYQTLQDAQRLGAYTPHLPRILSCAKRGGRTVVLMEYVEGISLREQVEALLPRERLSYARACFCELCEAVRELHELPGAPIIHRDVTPSNVIVCADDPRGLRLVDMGIARTYKAGADNDTVHFGTRAYAPPEQFGFSQTDVRTDVYALGLVLFFCLTGRDPELPDRQAGYVDPAIPRPLSALIARAANLDPAQRYPSVRALAQAFELACPREEPAALPEQRDPQDSAIEDVLPTGPYRVLSRVPRPVGVAWNIYLCLLYLIYAIGCIEAAFNPDNPNASWPLWLRVFVYLIFMLPAGLPIVWVFVDKRGLAKRFPPLRRRKWLREAAFALVSYTAGILVCSVLITAFGA